MNTKQDVLERHADSGGWSIFSRNELYKSVLPVELVRCTELGLDQHDNLIEIHRVPGQNDIGKDTVCIL